MIVENAVFTHADTPACARADIPADDAGSAPPARRELTAALFKDGSADSHRKWRKTISTEPFRFRPELCTEERWELSYARLRAFNEEIESPEELARDPRGLAAMHEWAAVVDGALATVAGIHYNLFLGSLVDDDSTDRDLAPFHALARTGTFLCTERGHGNDAAALETTATYDPQSQEFVLHTPHERAQKYMPNTSPAGGPKSAVVAARLLVDGADHGVFLFLTPLTDADGTLPGVTVEPLPDRVGSPVDHCVTSFDRVRLPRTALVQGPHGRLLPDGTLRTDLGSQRKRFLHAIARVTTGKLCMSASTLGGSRAALAIAVRYAHTRRISGPSAGSRVQLAAHRSHGGRLLKSLATAYAMTFLHRRVMDLWIHHEPAERDRTERLVAVVKGWITWHARALTIEARERCGARALFPVNGLAEYPANADGAITAEGDNLAVWCKAGAEMIFGHTPAEPTVRRTPVPQGTSALGDPVFLRDLLAVAEGRWHHRARLNLRSGPSGDSLGRWNNASSAALELVDTHATLLAADAFIAATEGVRHPATRAVLRDLCVLFLLDAIAPRTGELLADGHLTAVQVRAFPDTVDRLTAQLAPHLGVIADAFDVPEEHLGDLPMLTAP
ncbi:acyl-CoA dehydrogenase family protein [Streptomyces yaizuensis]|uniref:Acyl-CoA oxidase n=1 Tax=Streptomyces yaizuensis TaxID=2989713 RepID=A0ABQ5NTD2_9ACTN|nr:acyl-CoA dehydrogenase [Streptomyces sp. YSPA8]GLF93633.1 acyl-CoA oxidase [Streptomyces sp. YSPA8]